MQAPSLAWGASSRSAGSDDEPANGTAESGPKSAHTFRPRPGRFKPEPAAGDQLSLEGLFVVGQETKELHSGRSIV